MLDRFAVVIGLNYTNFPSGVSTETASRAGMNVLRFAEADAEAVAEVLRVAGYNVECLLGATATRKAIIAALRRQSLAANTEGLLLVYFAGHGDVDPHNPDIAYLLPADADPEELDGTAIPLEDLAGRHLGKVTSALTLLDCCHSGYALGLRGGVRQFEQQAQRSFSNVRGRIVIAACAGNQLAREITTLGHGAFTYYALEHWQTHPEEVNDFTLSAHVVQALEQVGLPPPVRGGVQEGRIVLRAPAPPSTLTWQERDALYDQLMKALTSLQQVRDFCFALRIDYESLPGNDRRSKIQHLILATEGLRRIGDLKNLLQAVIERKERQLEQQRQARAVRAAALQMEQARREQAAREAERAVQEQRKQALAQIALAVEQFTQTRLRDDANRRREELYSLLVTIADAQQIQQLCLALQVEYATLEKMDDSGKISWLIMTMAQAGRIDDLKHVVDTLPIPRSRPPSSQRSFEPPRIYVTPPAPAPTIGKVTQTTRLTGNSDAISSVTFANSSQILATGDRAGTVRLWRVGRGTIWQTLHGPTAQVYSVAFAPDGKMLAAASADKLVRLWDTNKGTILRILEHPQPVYSVAFAPNGQMLATGCRDNTVRVWRVAGGQLISSFTGHANFVAAVAFGRDGQILASASGDKTIRLWNTSDGRLLGALEGHDRPIWSLAFAPDGQLLASGAVDSTVRLWDTSSGRLLHTLRGHSGPVNSVTFAADGKILASGGNDKVVRLWRAVDGTALGLLTGHATAVESVDFAPNGLLLATGDRDGAVRLWQITYK